MFGRMGVARRRCAACGYARRCAEGAQPIAGRCRRRVRSEYGAALHIRHTKQARDAAIGGVMNCGQWPLRPYPPRMTGATCTGAIVSSIISLAFEKKTFERLFGCGSRNPSSIPHSRRGMMPGSQNAVRAKKKRESRSRTTVDSTNM